MEVRLSTESDPIRPWPNRPVTRPEAVPENSPDFRGTNALDAALQAAPGVRADALERGRSLVSDVNYPPLETIRRIAALLVSRMHDDPH